MTDHTELKQLAEAAIEALRKRREAAGVGALPDSAAAFNHSQMPRKYDDDVKAANKAYRKASDPQAVLDLIAEVEQSSEALGELRRFFTDMYSNGMFHGDDEEPRMTQTFYIGEDFQKDGRCEVDRLKDQITRLTQERDEAREALRPFGELGALLGDMPGKPDMTTVDVELAADHLRRAASVIKRATGGE